MKYYKKTADFQNGDYLVTKVFKNINIIIKFFINIIIYFDIIK
jgi:hypothetical protein